MSFKYLRSAITFAAIICLSNGGYSQKFVNEFLNIGVGARAHGMFGSVVANVSDGTAAYWNPSGLTEIKNPLQINAMHAKWFGGISNYDYVSIVRKSNSVANSAFALSVIRLGIDNIPNTLNLIGPDGTFDYNRVTNFSASDYAGILSYARNIGRNSNFSIGGNLKIIHRTIGSFAKAWGFGFDLGIKYKSGPLLLGANVRDITSTFNAWTFNLSQDQKDVFSATGNDIPISSTEVSLPRLIVGAGYSINGKEFSYLGEVDLNISTNGTEAGLLSGNKLNIDPTFGIEVGYVNKVFIRAGAGNIQSVINPTNAAKKSFEIQPNIGLGLVLGRLKVDYALTNIGSVSGILVSHIFSLSLDFIPKKQAGEI